MSVAVPRSSFNTAPSTQPPVRRHARALARFGASFLVVFLLVCGKAAAQNVHNRENLRIGVLVSLTGTWSTLGKNTVAALDIAAAKINAQSDADHDDYHVQLLVRDTQLIPALALEDLKELHHEGVRVVIGPQSSAEVQVIRPYADTHNMLVISQSSTASSLAIAGDNVFRFCPDDTLEAQAIVGLMWHDGIRTIVPLWRNDAGNNGLHDSVTADFTKMGGTVTAGFNYAPSTTDFTAALSAVSSQVSSASSLPVAVYLAGFDEVTDIFDAINTNSVLYNTPWYGSDGIANSYPLLSNPVAANFAIHAGFPNPTFGLDPNTKSTWQPVATEIEQETGITPDAFALATYDALFVAYRALQESRGGRDFHLLKKEFVETADSYTGLTGPTTLNAAGDRTFADFDFWAIRPVGNTLSWVVIGNSINGTLTLY